MADDDYSFCLEWLQEYYRSTGCAIHAYVIMTNHVHLLLAPKNKESAGNLVKSLGQRYIQYIDHTYKRSGTLWEGRFRSSVIPQNMYLLTCQRYIEMNPVCAEMVVHPGAYKWSSYQANGQAHPSNLITPHSIYRDLGADDTERLSDYRKLFRHELDPGEVDKVRKATNGNFAMGSSRFQGEISNMLGRRVTPGYAGRPRREKAEKSR